MHIIEKVVACQLGSKSQGNTICEIFQLGFRAHHSTDKVMEAINDILLASAQGCVFLHVLLDLIAIFDIIHHNILQHKIENVVGVKRMAPSWLRS